MSPVNVRPSWINVRPSWIDVNVEGRESGLAAGPRSRDGSMTAGFSVRENGYVLPVLDVECIASRDKKTVLMRVTDIRTGKVLFEERFVQ